MAIRDAGGLDLLINVLETNDIKCKIGTLRILQLISKSTVSGMALVDHGGGRGLGVGLGVVDKGAGRRISYSCNTLSTQVTGLMMYIVHCVSTTFFLVHIYSTYV